MDMLGPYQGMPDGFQHLDLTLGQGGPFPVTGGQVNASQWLSSIGYRGQQIPGQTRGPNMGGGGGGMPNPFGMGGGNPFAMPGFNPMMMGMRPFGMM